LIPLVSPRVVKGSCSGTPALLGSEKTNATLFRQAAQVPAQNPASAHLSPASPPQREPQSADRRRPWFLLVITAAAVILAVAVLTTMQRAEPARVGTPQPVIPGQMGEHFTELEESVTS
jgi:eukaryotic-like serine/threonine-protein kinase